MRKFSIFLVLFAAVALGACQTLPAPITAPVVIPGPVVTPIPPIADDGVDEEPQPVSNAITRDVYSQVIPGMTLTAIQTIVGQTQLAIPPVRQPGGGKLYRYKILDSDGKWRGRHANFIVGSNNVLVRKSIS